MLNFFKSNEGFFLSDSYHIVFRRFVRQLNLIALKVSKRVIIACENDRTEAQLFKNFFSSRAFRLDAGILYSD